MKICKHFGNCGGCSFQNIPYLQQLKNKEEKLKKLLSYYEIDTSLKPINSYREWFYRNKMEFTFSFQEKIILGLHHKNKKRKVVDIEECLIASRDTEKILNCVKKFANKKNYPVYHKFTHRGFLRHLIIREAKFTNQIMVGIVTTSLQDLDKEEFINDLLNLKLEKKLKSIWWIINDALSDAVVFQKKELLWGDCFIQEELGEYKFNIGIDSFFQVNSFGIKDLYEKITDYTCLTGKEKVLDLYCGVGCIGIFLSKKAKFVWGIELKKEIVEAASENAKLNKIENVSFLTDEVRRFLNLKGSFYRGIDLVVINPPRCGLSKKVIRAILRLEPKMIIYSSCNPDTFCRDLKALNSLYKINFIEPFDFFPHTIHLECLALLDKIS
jgi:23S rRNA (uracil-5-)-methyltransferase RumA